MWNPGSFDLQMSPISGPAFTPSCDLEETETHYLMSFDLPGVKKDDIKIDLRDDVLTVSGERKEEREEKNGQKYQSERFLGTFMRSFQVPAGLKPEQVEAHYADGVLRVAVPKTETAKAQQIKISEGKAGFWDKLLGKKKEESKPDGNGKTSPDSGPRLQVKAG
jgi:HSP20 family protein